MRLLDALRPAAEKLEDAGIDDPLAEAEMIVFHAAGMDRLAAYTQNPEIGGSTRARITRLIKRRLRGEPLQYITGSVEFLGLHIAVGKGVLIPRPETELLVQEAISRLREARGWAEDLRILDLCTGSGCIALALAKEFPRSSVICTDTSKTAIRYARKNAVLNGIGNVRFVGGSLFDAMKKRSFDLIISNPPYVRTVDISGLQSEVRDWEPRVALDGGEDGLNYYREILSGAGEYMRQKGLIVLELGYDQAEAVQKIASGEGFTEIEVKKDYAGIERIFSAVFRGDG